MVDTGILPQVFLQVKIIKIMWGKKYGNQMSATNCGRCINHIVEEFKKQVLEQVFQHGSLSIQLEERMNISTVSGLMLDSALIKY